MNNINIRVAKSKYVMSKMAFEIYLQGCDVRCPSCNHNDTWNWKAGKKFPASTLSKRFKEFDIAIQRFFITGGEPLQQDHNELIKMIEFLKQFNKEIWLFTSYEMYQIPDNIKALCDYIKTGIYDTTVKRGEEKYGFKLATINQKLFKSGIDF